VDSAALDIIAQTTLLRQRVEAALRQAIARHVAGPQRLVDAVRYGLLGPGKRIRPILSYVTGQVLGLELRHLDAAACAVEMMHAYSLIHDDLPAMDDDDLRRGRPTCHRAFDQATAILAGDALQTLAFEVLTDAPLGSAAAEALVEIEPARRLAVVRRLAVASGVDGMVGGQALDLAAEAQAVGIEALALLHARKTGALISASVMMAADLAGAAPSHAQALECYAGNIGLAFQVRDDILDVEGDEMATGKRSGADARLQKSTYPALLGLEGAKRQAAQLLEQALAALQPLGPAARPLQELARFVVERRH
jgi:geranylgeranyl diphosphate synthase, type II